LNGFTHQGKRLLARTWVISPDPELMKHIPDEKRFVVVHNVTEQTFECWYSDNGWGQPAYSYVIHDKHRVADREQMVHAHIITPATIRIDEAGELGRIDVRRNSSANKMPVLSVSAIQAAASMTGSRSCALWLILSSCWTQRRRYVSGRINIRRKIATGSTSSIW
jgi:hypothetical protein